jgi:GNAT superfamily N-acetyltransferase
VVIGRDPLHDLRHEVRVVARSGGEEVARAWLYNFRDTGWMRGAYVEPAWRGRGLQRSLLFARARLAMERGCDLVGATAEPGTVSAANMYAAGMTRLASRSQYRYTPPNR